ncbi:hypothetical protein [Desulfosporosinus sp. FKA]|uniref:hypothetical protein n=1 Tax=Desulfosporosinus sp. FKA TaxID=1969834 RepID=UPI000B49AB53|nr:hypothetical protein [Desulfosporosinus sp. FKA]
MAMLVFVSNEGRIIQQKIIKRITEEEENIAISIFNEYQSKGIILSEFANNKWKITNEIDVIGLNFEVNEIFIKKHLKSYTAKEFVDILKYFICFCLGHYSIQTLKVILANIKKAIVETSCFLVIPKQHEVLEGTGVSDFIDIFPYSNEELIIESIDYTHKKFRRRALAEYESYFLFDEILNDFWKDASDDEKNLYYPIYLWWNISMIIPLRVTEFTVIPKICFRKEKNKWMLKVRRTDLKGRAGKVHKYSLDEDYKIYEYAVNDTIISMIQDYKDRATKFNEAEIDSLFSDDMFVTMLNNTTKTNLERMGHLKVSHMTLLMECFFKYIIGRKYGYKVLSKEDVLKVDINGELKRLNKFEIVRILLGDSRHIAMQNMLLNGCNILMAKEITGHESPDMIYHYAGNMRNLIKCRAYSLYKMSKPEKVEMLGIIDTNTSVLLFGEEDPHLEVDGGLCYSKLFVLKHDVTDCFAVAGKCEKCNYFKSEKDSKLIRKEQEKTVEETIERLKIWLNSTRINKNKDEFRVLASKLASQVENLQNGYVRDLEEGGKI